jgi:hypothetical protein
MSIKKLCIDLFYCLLTCAINDILSREIVFKILNVPNRSLSRYGGFLAKAALFFSPVRHINVTAIIKTVSLLPLASANGLML